IKFETNCGPRSEMILHGILWLCITRSRRMWAAPWAVRVVFTGSSKVIFVSLLQITRMQSYVFDLGIGPMISQEIMCHGCGGMSWGWRGAHRFVLSGLLLWHFSHPCTYRITSSFQSGH